MTAVLDSAGAYYGYGNYYGHGSPPRRQLVFRLLRSLVRRLPDMQDAAPSGGGTFVPTLDEGRCD